MTAAPLALPGVFGPAPRRRRRADLLVDRIAAATVVASAFAAGVAWVALPAESTAAATPAAVEAVDRVTHVVRHPAFGTATLTLDETGVALDGGVAGLQARTTYSDGVRDDAVTLVLGERTFRVLVGPDGAQVTELVAAG